MYLNSFPLLILFHYFLFLSRCLYFYSFLQIFSSPIFPSCTSFSLLQSRTNRTWSVIWWVPKPAWPCWGTKYFCPLREHNPHYLSQLFIRTGSLRYRRRVLATNSSFPVKGTAHTNRTTFLTEFYTVLKWNSCLIGLNNVPCIITGFLVSGYTTSDREICIKQTLSHY
jgi:hypothetical protein